MGNKGAVNSFNIDHQGAGQVSSSVRFLPKVKLREFLGDTRSGRNVVESFGPELAEVHCPMMRK